MGSSRDLTSRWNRLALVLQRSRSRVSSAVFHASFIDSQSKLRRDGCQHGDVKQPDLAPSRSR